MSHSTLTTKQQLWFDHVQAANGSEGSMAAYAAQPNLLANSKSLQEMVIDLRETVAEKTSKLKHQKDLIDALLGAFHRSLETRLFRCRSGPPARPSFSRALYFDVFFSIVLSRIGGCLLIFNCIAVILHSTRIA